MKNLALEASAGTGKTYNLSLRFIALVLSKENGEYKNISNILAITFTNKAANEMKERIIGSFISLDEAQNLDKLDFLSKMLNISKDEVLKRQQERKAAFLATELRIYTFDAFFGKILRQFSLNAGLMPDFEIDTKLDYKINENYLKNLDYKELEKLAVFISSTFNNAAGYLEAIKKMSLYDISFLLTPKPDESELWRDFENLKKIAQPNCAPRYQDKFNITKPNQIAQLLFSPTGYKEPQKAINNCPFEKEKLIKSLEDYFIKFKEYKISHFFEYIKEYKKARNKMLKNSNKLDFSDVSLFLYEMLKNGEKKIDINELYFRLDGKISDILIDEFQDTNALQYEIMMPLISEALAGKGQNEDIGSLFYVGDIKQSIYGFRDAQKDIFEHLYKVKFPQQIKNESLDKNYRSDENIVKFIDEKFAAVYEQNHTKYLKQKVASDESGYVEIVSFAGQNCKEELKSFEEVLINRLNFLKEQNIDESDITILCWQNKDIAMIKDLLLGSGFKVASKARELTELRQIKLVLEYLNFALFKSEYSQKLLEQFGFKADEKVKIHINSPEKTLKIIASKLGIDEFEPNMLLLYELAIASKNIYEFFKEIKKTEAKAHIGASEGINIMTVHKSKGLGFEHCIICDNMSPKNNDKNAFLSYFDLAKNSWQITLNDKVLEYLKIDEHIRQKVEQNDKDEQINKQYVAFTRAKHSLIALCANSEHGAYPSYFKPYGTKVKEQKEPVLFLKDEKIGQIKKAEPKAAQKEPLENSKMPVFQKVSRQNVSATPPSKIEFSSLESVYFGKALHYAFEMSGDFSASCVEFGVLASFNKYGAKLENSAFENIKARILNFAKLKEREFSGFKMLKEQEILYNSKLLRLDLLLVNDEKIVIIDYKSSFSAATNSSEQMQNYIKAINEIYAKPTNAYFAVFDGQNNCILKEVML